MTKMVGKTRGLEGGVNFWASENWSGRVHFEGHSPEWRVLSKLSVQPCYGEKLSFLCIIFSLFLQCNMAAVQNLL